MKELNNDILNNQGSYSSETDEYTSTVSHGKSSANVILKLVTNPNEEPTQEELVKGLVQYISAFEDILTWQSEN